MFDYVINFDLNPEVMNLSYNS